LAKKREITSCWFSSNSSSELDVVKGKRSEEQEGKGKECRACPVDGRLSKRGGEEIYVTRQRVPKMMRILIEPFDAKAMRVKTLP